MAEETCESRAAALIMELRGMIAASYLAGDKELAAEKRHATGVLRTAVDEALERAAALAEKSGSPPDSALIAAIRDLKEKPTAGS